MYLKVHLTEEEKSELAKIAKNRGISLSQLCYDQLEPLIRAPLLYYNLSPTLEDHPKHSTRDKLVKVYLNETEYNAVLKQARGSSMSSYIRNVLIYHRDPIDVYVITEDIIDLTRTVSKYIEQFHNFVAALAIRQQLYEADYDRLIEIANDTAKALRDTANVSWKNRKSIRASGIRIVRKEIQKAVDELKEKCK